MPKQESKPLVGINEERAGWAMEAVETFMQETGLTEADGIETAIGDLLGDIRHLCDKRSLDFDELVAKGKGYYDEEVACVCKKCKRTFDIENGDGVQDDDETTTCKDCEEAE
jgi:hypothetical protein